jgi:hypothetical protein
MLAPMTLGVGAVVISSCGEAELNRALLEDCRREMALIDVLIVDNHGILEDLPGARVLRPGRNLGWLGGTNFGVRHAINRGHRWVVALNNHTRLSNGFFDGLRRALDAHPRSIVAPCYDGLVGSQSAYYRGPVSLFQPQDTDIPASLIDGTSYAMTVATATTIGQLDAEHFGRLGRGAIEDYLIRARNHNIECVVTRRSYLAQLRGSTAHSVTPQYERRADAEMRRGLRRKHGPGWRHYFPDTPQRPDGWLTMLSDTFRTAAEPDAGG